MQQFFSPFDIIAARDWMSLKAAIFEEAWNFHIKRYVSIPPRVWPKENITQVNSSFYGPSDKVCSTQGFAFQDLLSFSLLLSKSLKSKSTYVRKFQKNWNGYVLDSNQIGKDSPNWRNCLTTSWLRKKKLCCQKSLCGQNLRKYRWKKIVVTRCCQGYLYVIKRGLHLKL